MKFLRDVGNVTRNRWLTFGDDPPAFICLFVCLSVCVQHNSKSYGSILMKFLRYVGTVTKNRWLSFGDDPEEIMDSGSLWNFREHCPPSSLGDLTTHIGGSSHGGRRPTSIVAGGPDNTQLGLQPRWPSTNFHRGWAASHNTCRGPATVTADIHSSSLGGLTPHIGGSSHGGRRRRSVL